MKIAQISTLWLRTPPIQYGETETVVSAFTEQLVALGHDVTLFATSDSIITARLWSCYDRPTQTFHLLDEAAAEAGGGDPCGCPDFLSQVRSTTSDRIKEKVACIQEK